VERWPGKGGKLGLKTFDAPEHALDATSQGREVPLLPFESNQQLLASRHGSVA
jgi:hypothetical protein